jgi:hypothetical protein
VHDAPKLLVEWASPWEEFKTALRPAFMRSPERLAGEARVGLFPYRGILVSWVLEAALLIAIIVIPTEIARMHPYVAPPLPKYDVIYYSADELPRTEDLGGARAGNTGRAGGREAYHHSQTIRVARGETLRDRVVDAPKLNLPRSDSAVANLLAYKAVPGPAPAEGLRPALRLPQLPQNVVAPAPQVERDKMRAAPGLSTEVVPPPASVDNLHSLRLPGSHVVEVVPPPVSAPEQITSLKPKITLPAPQVVAPAPQVTRDVVSRGPGLGSGEIRNQVVPPPVQVSNGTGERRAVSGLGAPSVVAPPVQVAGGSLQRQGSNGLGGSAAVVPPPPTVAGTSTLGGQGRGNRGAGFGGSLDAGDVSAPPKSGGNNANGTGVVVSNQPGSTVGVPGNGGAGSLAMSPAGGTTPGLGGSGGGTGIGRGNGPGSGFSGEGTGAAKSGTGRGSDPNARAGLSPYPGPGGAGSGTSGSPPLPGVSVRGGNSNVVNLPSFEGGGGSQPNDPSRSTAVKDRKGPGITIVATSRSGGAFNFYGTLKGDNYTIYIETALGTAVMQYADPASATHQYNGDLVAPEPIRSDLPANLRPSRLVIACTLDRSGAVKNAKVLEGGAAELTPKVLAALPNWKFRPALRGNEPVEVNAILGFAIDTR